MELSAGLMVNPNIRLLEPIGEGAMGSVWSAEHLTLHTTVAVKFIGASMARDNPELVERFKREASVAARIKSPHVVQTFDQGFMADGTPYIVMEMLEGETLMELIERLGPLPVPVATQVMVQLSRALAKAHEAGVVHRDIKPDNVFCTPSDEGLFCKVLDFGIAKSSQLPQMGGLTSPGVLVGTPEFMSPEQVLSSKDVDHRADLWALGVTMYQVLTGKLPFTGEAIGELCMKLLTGNIEPPSRLRSDLHPSIDAWFARALARKPEERYGSAREMARAFLEIVSKHHAVAGDATISSMLRALTDASASEMAAFGAGAHTLSGSSSPKVAAPENAGRKRRTAMVGLAVTAATLALGAIITFVVVQGDEPQAPAASATSETPPAGMAASAASAPGTETGEPTAASEPREAASAAAASSSAAASASAPPARTQARPPVGAQRPSASPPRAPRGASTNLPVHEDHGF